MEQRNPHKFSLRKRLHSFVYAGRGLKLLWQEHNTRIHALATVLVVVVGLCLGLTPIEWVAVAIVIGLVWVAEGLNTAIERLCDHVTPGEHPHIAGVKDVSAGAVLLAAITAVVVGLIIFVPHIVEAIAGII